MKIMFVILFIEVSFSQSTSLSLYGVGEKYGVTAASTIGLGNSTFFSGNKYNISTNSPSSLWRSTLTRFTIHSGMNYLTSPQITQQYEQNLTFFSISFPCIFNHHFKRSGTFNIINNSFSFGYNIR